MSSSNYKYRSLQIEVSLSSYGRGWLSTRLVAARSSGAMDGRTGTKNLR